MSGFLNQQLTNVGWDALSIALGGGRLTFYKMQAGSGIIANDAAIPPMTALVEPVYDIAITSYVIEGDGQITLFGNIASDLLDGGFDFKELGVFATIEQPIAGKGGIPGGPNIQAIVQAPTTQANPVIPQPSVGTALMYSYCNAYNTADYIPGSGESTSVVNTVQVTIKIDQAPNVQINILQGETFSVVNIGPPSAGAGPWSYTQANVGYFKRLVAGAATLITEDTNTITIGQKQLTTDLDLYVANGNPDISPHFSSIQKALDYLGQFLIPVPIQARIHVSADSYVSSNLIVVDHPSGQAITIQGSPTTTRTSSGTTVTGGSGNWSMTFSGISSTAEFQVGKYAMILSASGTYAGLTCGMYLITAKTANSVTARSNFWPASFPVTGGASAYITPINVVLARTAINQPVVYVGAYGLKAFRYMAVVSPGGPTTTVVGVTINGTSNFEFSGVTGFQASPNAAGNNFAYGFHINTGANVNFSNCVSTYNMIGFAGNGGAVFSTCAATDCYLRGFWAQGSGASFGFEGYCTVSGINESALAAGSNASLTVGLTGYVLSAYNFGAGLTCGGGGSLAFSGPSSTLNMQANYQGGSGGYDAIVYNFGLINNSNRIVGSRIFNAPIGIITSSGGLIN